MSETPKDIVGYSGVDDTTDPFVLGQKDPTKSSMSLNYRAKSGVKKMRPRYSPVLSTGESGCFSKSGVYFPYNSKAILPHTSDKYDGTFYLASTDTTSQKAFTIEFWYKCDYVPDTRDICNIPVYFEPDDRYYATSHMHVYMKSVDDSYPWIPRLGDTFLCLQLTLESSPLLKAAQATFVSKTLTMPTDGEWHHIAIKRGTTGGCSWYLDTVSKGSLTWQNPGALSQAFEGDRFATDTQFKTESLTPLYNNHLEIGSGNISIADFRIWSDERSASEIASYYKTELAGTESNLVCYVPFNEGDGKYFTELVNSVRGYFSPQEPWVNDDNELVFTGYKCMAYPSLRSKYKLPKDLPATLTKSSTHVDLNEDGAYDGGILWDDTLLLGTAFDYEENGVWAGTAQLRIRLRQLKEGVLCGRLGLLYDSDAHRYRLFLVDDTNAAVYTSYPVVDSTWIGAEKTITVKYFGDSTLDDFDICKFYVDSTEVTDLDPTTTEDLWANGDTVYDTTYPPYTDYDGTDNTSGAIGGSTVTTEMCVAFDLIFLRQWWDNVHGQDDNDSTYFDAFVAATYNVNVLTEEYRVWFSGLSGYIADGGTGLTIATENVDLGINNPFNEEGLGFAYVRMPLQKNMSWDSGDANSNYDGSFKASSLSCIQFTGGNETFKQDVLVRRIHDYPSADELQILRSATSYDLCDHFGGEARINGILISNLVNCFDQNTFKLNWEERPIYEETTSDDTFFEYMFLRVMGTIVDDSPVQGIEKIGGTIYKSKYLSLGLEERYKTIYGQRSLKPRWCTGPVLTNIVSPAVRGIFRYKSENGSINKLLAVVWNGVYSIDETTGALTAEPMGWIERNDDSGVNFVALNNRLVIMDSKNAIKINYLGNFSRLGVERPVELTADAVGVSLGNPSYVFNALQDNHFAWTAQFYDSENNSYSGTLPIFKDMFQTIFSESDTSKGHNFVEIQFRTCFDENVDGFRIFRTQDMEDGSGTHDALFLVSDSVNTSNLNEFNIVRDTWDDSKIVEQYEADKSTFLPFGYQGVDLVPPSCSAASVGYGRLFLLNTDKANAALFWSNVDDLGLAVPDEVSPKNSIIVEEGNTTSGTALIEYSSSLFVFKDDAIFRVSQINTDKFGVELIYKGVGCVNQQCVVVAGDAIVFLDKNGVYRYSGGEPNLISAEFTEYFKKDVNQDQIEKSFMIHDKDNDVVMIFLPVGEEQVHCNRCLVGDLRNGTWTIDHITDLSCGYYDDGTLYVGSPHGQIYKMTYTDYKDWAYALRSGTGTAT